MDNNVRNRIATIYQHLQQSDPLNQKLLHQNKCSSCTHQSSKDGSCCGEKKSCDCNVDQHASPVDYLEKFKHNSSSPLYIYRKQASFDPLMMKKFVWGREYGLKLTILTTLAQDPLFRQPIAELNLPKDEYRELAAKQFRRLVEYDFVPLEESIQDPWKWSALTTALYNYDASSSTKFFLHVGMFINCIRMLGTDRHQKYIPPCRSLEIVGCFALTELAHGSNAKAMQTTATFIPETQEFEIHSPSHESYKWWIGLAGKTANYTCLLAKLILNGRDYGLHPFLVPIRSQVNHQPFPGVIVGDLGDKLGQNGLDNGFIGFDHYRIPRENLLNRIADVLPNGEYTAENIPPNKRFAMLLNPLSAGRVGIVGICQISLINALVIAIRYSAARKQFGPPGNSDELPVIEYQLQQYRLLPFLAGAYAMEFFRTWLSDNFVILDKQIQNQTVDENLLAEIHALSSAAKPLAGWQARDGIQTARECCGGHGYSTCNRIGALRNDSDPNLTYEGENNVLIQQTAKYLVDQLQSKMTNRDQELQTPLKSVNWINSLPKLLESKCKATNEQDFLDPSQYVHILHFRVSYLLTKSAMKVRQLVSEGTDPFTAWNESQVFLLHACARAYIELQVIEHFVRVVEAIDVANQPLKNTLKALCDLYALTRIQNDLGVVRANDFMSSEQASLLQNAILNLCRRVKTDCVSLVDALAPPDELLYSPIGLSDGLVYKNLFNAVTTAPGCFERPSWWTLFQTPVNRGGKSPFHTCNTSSSCSNCK